MKSKLILPIGLLLVFSLGVYGANEKKDPKDIVVHTPKHGIIQKVKAVCIEGLRIVGSLFRAGDQTSEREEARKIESWLRKNRKHIYPRTLTRDDQAQIRWYTNVDFAAVNNILEKGTLNEESQAVKDAIFSLDNAIASTRLPENVVFYAGRMGPEWVTLWQSTSFGERAMINNKTYISASMWQNFANWQVQSHLEQSVILRIKAAKGTHAVYSPDAVVMAAAWGTITNWGGTTPLDFAPAAYGFILPRNSAFRVIGATIEKGQKILDVEFVEDALLLKE